MTKTLLLIIEASVLNLNYWGLLIMRLQLFQLLPPYIHKTVYHNFFKSIIGACTNHVEGFWKYATRLNKQMSETNDDMLPIYFNKFMRSQIKKDLNFLITFLHKLYLLILN